MKPDLVMRLAAALAALCLGMQPTPALSEPCSLVIVSRLDVQAGTGLIPASINGAQAALELDTGAFSTILTPAAARRFDLRPDLDRSLSFRGQPEESYESYGVGGKRLLRKLIAKTFDLGDRLHGRQFRHAAARLGLQDAALAGDPRVQVKGIGPEVVEAVRHRIGTLTVGDLTLKNTKMLILNDRPVDNTDVLLGADFQHKMHLWISYSTHALVIEYPPQPSPPVP